jgi:hypothetical protein
MNTHRIATDTETTMTHPKRSATAALAGILALAATAGLAGDFGTRLLSPGELTARGPISGDVALYQKEFDCAQTQPTPGYFQSLNAAEISGATRSGLFPCATFTGSFDGPNQVFAYKADGDYQGISYISNRNPGEIYIVGGEYPTPDDPFPSGPYVAKADATTGKEVWRTYLDNQNVSGRFIGNSNLNILDNGMIAQSWSNQIVLLDGDTGRVMKHNTLPTGDTPVSSVNYKHLTVAPDGTLILKNQTRPIGCTIPGTMGIIQCSAKGMKMPPSHLTAVDPDTLEILDDISLPGPAASPHIIDMLDDKIAIYFGTTEKLYRYFWDPAAKKLSADDSWVAEGAMAEGQTALTAPTIMGDWVAVQVNGLFTNKKASSVVAVHKRDASKLSVIFPFGELKPGEISFAPPKTGGDPENNMIYSADMGMKKVAGIRIDPETGAMETRFVIDDISNTFQPLIGPKDQRVLVLTNIRLRSADQSMLESVFTQNQYTEQLTWRDAATGAVLAESDFFEPLTINSLTTPGFGGRIYFPTAVGRGFYVLQVMPKPQPQQPPAGN